jgi:hypothetical protein
MNASVIGGTCPTIEAAEDRVGRPEQRGEREQQIGLLEQPAAGVARASLFSPNHVKVPRQPRIAA